MKKKLLTSIIFLCLLLTLFNVVYAHSGRTDSKGGHYNRKTGEYHYHNGGSSSSGSTSTNTNTYKPTTVLPKSITISNTPKIIMVGEQFQLQSSVSPSNTTNKNVVWSSSDNKIATVDSVGKITAIKDGKITVTATSSNGVKQTLSLQIVNVKQIYLFIVFSAIALCTITFIVIKKLRYKHNLKNNKMSSN